MVSCRTGLLQHEKKPPGQSRRPDLLMLEHSLM
jgi:hypothetical protein